MRSIAFAVAGPLDTRTGGSIYNRRMIDGLRRRGWAVTVHALDASFPFPSPSALNDAEGVLAGMADGSVVVVDGLAFGAMPEIARRASARLRLVALVHLPLAAAVGLEAAQVERFEASERCALAAAALVVVTGAHARQLMAAHGLSHQRVAVVEPGTDPAPPARPVRGAELEILTAATLNAGKGHELLIDALAPLSDRRWRLTCAGSLTRDPATVARVRARIARYALDTRIALVGELSAEELAARYARAGLYVSASVRETYGMALADALAHGVPVVATATGAAPELVGEDAGSVVPAGDAGALTAALARMIDDGDWRARCAAGARRAGERLPDWDRAAARFASALEDL